MSISMFHISVLKEKDIMIIFYISVETIIICFTDCLTRSSSISVPPWMIRLRGESPRFLIISSFSFYPGISKSGKEQDADPSLKQPTNRTTQKWDKSLFL